MPAVLWPSGSRTTRERSSLRRCCRTANTPFKLEASMCLTVGFEYPWVMVRVRVSVKDLPWPRPIRLRVRCGLICKRKVPKIRLIRPNIYQASNAQPVLTLGDSCVPATVNFLHYHVTGSILMVAGPFQWPAPQSGALSRILSGTLHD